MAHCHIANQGRLSFSTASILTPLDTSRRRSHDMKSDKWSNNLAMLGTMSCIYDMPLNDMQFASTETKMLKKTLENRLGITVKLEISSTVRNSPNRSPENAKFRIPKVTIITPNCQPFCWGHPSKLGDIPPRNLLGIAMNHPMLAAINYKVSN